MKKPQIDEVLRQVNKPWPGANKKSVIKRLRDWQDEERKRLDKEKAEKEHQVEDKAERSPSIGSEDMKGFEFPELPDDPRVVALIQWAFDQTQRSKLGLPPRGSVEERVLSAMETAGLGDEKQPAQERDSENVQASAMMRVPIEAIELAASDKSARVKRWTMAEQTADINKSSKSSKLVVSGGFAVPVDPGENASNTKAPSLSTNATSIEASTKVEGTEVWNGVRVW